MKLTRKNKTRSLHPSQQRRTTMQSLNPNRLATLAASLVLALVASANAETILIDFGATDKLAPTTGQVWNNVASGRLAGGPDANLHDLNAGDPDLLNSTGSDSGIDFDAVGTFDTQVGGNAVDFTGSQVASPTGTVYNSDAYVDSVFSGNGGGGGQATYTVTLSNLNPTSTYDLTFLSAYSGGNDNGFALWNVAGAALTSASTSTAHEFAQTLGISPDGSNQITIVFTDNPASGSLNGRWNTLEITVNAANVVPAPAALPVGLALIGLIAARRKR